jgi:hypothetical protein
MNPGEISQTGRINHAYTIIQMHESIAGKPGSQVLIINDLSFYYKKKKDNR